MAHQGGPGKQAIEQLMWWLWCELIELVTAINDDQTIKGT